MVSHYNVQPVFEIYADVQGVTWGRCGRRDRVVDSLKNELPRGSTFAIRGQVQTMDSSFSGLGWAWCSPCARLLRDGGEFQSWLDPFIILMALPGAWRAFCGCCS